MNLKEEVEGTPPLTVNFKRQFKMRPQFWKPCPWEWVTSHNPPSIASLKFPPDDLGAELVKLCFEKVMILYPIVHRPHFEKQLRLGLHHRDMNFARVYLLVCAIGSRFSEDERVALKNPEGEAEWASAGWMFFSQVMSIKRMFSSSVRAIEAFPHQQLYHRAHLGSSRSIRSSSHCAIVALSPGDICASCGLAHRRDWSSLRSRHRCPPRKGDDLREEVSQLSC